MIFNDLFMNVITFGKEIIKGQKYCRCRRSCPRNFLEYLLAKLTVPQAAYIAGCHKAQNVYSPYAADGKSESAKDSIRTQPC